VFRRYGFNLDILKNDDRSANEYGLKYVNNDACFPSITVVGQIMRAVHSGKYDLDRLAILMSQTGGGCRASNYVGFIRRALERDGLSHIPVISLSMVGMEKNPGFRLPLPMILKGFEALAYGDVFLKTLYRVRPYEAVRGAADKLHKELEEMCLKTLTEGGISRRRFSRNVKTIVERFDALPVREDVKKPRVGVVGEILVKYMPLANNNLVALLEREGAEVVVPGLFGFIEYCLLNSDFKFKYLGGKWMTSVLGRLGIAATEWMQRPAARAYEKSERFDVPVKITELAELAHPMLSQGNQCGEGWLLTGEMAELLHSGANNIVCVQPFACLPNHVVGKGVIHKLKEHYQNANVVTVDYDPGASEVNQLNRIKLMLTNARKQLLEEPSAQEPAPERVLTAK
jgi:predicted nucleotide-binding protein (sugar kinase/HSP70/actin superfamily)